jgi:hypothetical protein
MIIQTRSTDNFRAVDWDALPLLLDEKRTARVLGVSLSFLRKSRSEGTRFERTPAPPFVYVGGRVYYRLGDLKDWVDDLDGRTAVSR